MRLYVSPVFLIIFFAVSVRSYCLYVNCKNGWVAVGNRCRLRVRRSVEDGGCRGSNKLYISDEVLNHPGPLSINCPEGYVIDRQMKCAREGWEPGSGPWETHHYSAGYRYLVIEQKRSSQSIRYRSLSIT